MSAIIEETFNKVNTHKWIEGIILTNAEGVPIKSTFNEEEKTYYYTTSASMFVKKCRNVVKELIEEDLTFIKNTYKIEWNNDCSRKWFYFYSSSKPSC